MYVNEILLIFLIINYSQSKTAKFLTFYICIRGAVGFACAALQTANLNSRRLHDYVRTLGFCNRQREVYIKKSQYEVLPHILILL